MPEEMGENGVLVHPECINAANPYHICSEYCFLRIIEAQEIGKNNKKRKAQDEEEVEEEEQHNITLQKEDKEVSPEPGDVRDASPGMDAEAQERSETGASSGGDPEMEAARRVQNADVYANLTDRQKRLFDLRLKLSEARKANQSDIIAEKNREEAPSKESRGMSKKKWSEENSKRLQKQLEANGLDKTRTYMLDTQEEAEAKYKKWEKKPAPFGWDVFNQRTLYMAYKKRTKSVPYTMEDYLKAKEADPDFYRDGSSLQYGKAAEIPQENVDKMVKELEEKIRKRQEFSRRRRFHEEKDIDAINDRNEHFNKKIERAFGKYTIEIKNNLERGTALPD